MPATQFTRRERRALRWMRRRGLGLQPSEAAFDLLAARLDTRFRAGVAIWVPALAALVVWTTATTPRRLAHGELGVEVAGTLVPVLVFGVAFAAFALWCRRSDLALARNLPSRVTRPGVVPVSSVLGPLAVRVVALMVVLQVAVTVLLASRTTTEDAVAFGAGVAVVWLICGSMLRVVLRRPTIAPDTTALALDERLRAFDALNVLWPAGWASSALIAPLDLRGVPGAALIIVFATFGLILSAALPFSHPSEQVRYGFGRKGSRA